MKHGGSDIKNGNGSPAIRARGLSFSFNTGETILENVDFELGRGQSMAILGPNGSGKTTLLRLIIGLLKPASGTVEVFGGAPGRMRPHIGYVPQFSTVNADFPASALDVVLMGAARPSLFYGTGWSRSRASRDKAVELLKNVGFDLDAGISFGELSGGQRQKVLVARALMGRTDESDGRFVLILDEPTANVDPQGKFCFYEFLGGLRDSLTLVVVSHDLALASGSFDLVALVNRNLTLLREDELKGQVLGSFFGHHDDCCPVGSALQLAQRAFSAREGGDGGSGI